MKIQNQTSLKSAVNFERNKRFLLNEKLNKIKWFDNLGYREKQDYYNKFKRRKSDLVWITNEDKVCIYNKEHNGWYTKY
jgi:hypothetical protein